jgi:glycosyltransferase involved in cell wall biosynthesis
MPESIDVIIACHNEAETIEEVVLSHLKILENSETFDEFLITVLDDGSTDRSKHKILQLISLHENIKLISSDKPSGIHEAINKLVRSTSKKWVYFTPGDGQFSSKILSDLIFNFESNTWVIIAKRVNKTKIYSITRIVISFLYRIIVLIISGRDPIDAGSTKLVRRELFESRFYCNYIVRDAEIIIKAKKDNKNIKVIKSNFDSRSSGKSTIKIVVVLKSLLDSLNLIKYRF